MFYTFPLVFLTLYQVFQLLKEIVLSSLGDPDVLTKWGGAVGEQSEVSLSSYKRGVCRDY